MRRHTASSTSACTNSRTARPASRCNCCHQIEPGGKGPDARRLEAIVGGFRGRRIAVLADLVCDEFVHGDIARVSREALLVNRTWVDVAPFAQWSLLDAEQPNALLVGDTVVYPSAFPETRALLESHGIEVRVVDADELAKAEGGVTCCSILVA